MKNATACITAYAWSVGSNKILATGALLGFLGVAAGAFGAHALRAHLTPEHLAIYQTGVQYQMYHALAIVAVGAQTRYDLAKVAWLFSVGILIFSGSLYLLAITGITWLGAITPVGGLAFLGGWTLLAWKALKDSPGKA
jgi:uncharacterized membrane protein YgdD (TMEM256/DUF423 family)